MAWCPRRRESVQRRGLRVAAAVCGFLCSGAAYGDATVYGRVNLSLEHRTSDKATSTALRDNASRIGFVAGDTLDTGALVRFQLEHGFDATSGAAASPVFWNRRSELSIAGAAGKIRIGRFASEPYVAVADTVSMHNHDNGSSGDALYAYVGHDAGKIAYRTPTLDGFAVEISSSEGDESFCGARASDIVLSYAHRTIGAALAYGKKGYQHQFSLRGSATMNALTVSAYLQNDANVRSAGTRITARIAAMLISGRSEFHLNAGRAGAYSRSAPGNASALQFTVGYNYNFSTSTKIYALSTTVRDQGTLYGNAHSAGVGIRRQF